MGKSKFYCYVDETGQDTIGRFFLVAVVLTAQIKKDNLEAVIEEIENRTEKKKTKWTRTRTDIRIRFLEEISKVKDLQSSVYYSHYDGCITGYEQLTSLSIAKVIQTQGGDSSSVTIVIDALTRKGIEKTRHELKRLHVKYENIIGLKDEQSAFLRLADCFAGFIRDYMEGQSYTKKLFLFLESRGIVCEV